MQTEVATAAEAAGVTERAALPLSLGQQMAQQWRHREAAYLQGMSLVFAQLRTERAVYPGHYAAVRNVYLVFLQRSAQDKQDKVSHCLQSCTAHLRLLRRLWVVRHHWYHWILH